MIKISQVAIEAHFGKAWLSISKHKATLKGQFVRVLRLKQFHDQQKIGALEKPAVVHPWTIDLVFHNIEGVDQMIETLKVLRKEMGDECDVFLDGF